MVMEVLARQACPRVLLTGAEPPFPLMVRLCFIAWCFIILLESIKIIKTMQPFWRSVCSIQRCVTNTRSLPLQFSKIGYSNPSFGLFNAECNLPFCWGGISTNFLRYPTSEAKHKESKFLAHMDSTSWSTVILPNGIGLGYPIRHLTTVTHPEKAVNEAKPVASADTVQPKCIKFKRLDKTARHIMNILDKEEVDKVKARREIPEIKLGYIVQLKVVGLAGTEIYVSKA